MKYVQMTSDIGLSIIQVLGSVLLGIKAIKWFIQIEMKFRLVRLKGILFPFNFHSNFELIIILGLNDLIRWNVSPIRGPEVMPFEIGQMKVRPTINDNQRKGNRNRLFLVHMMMIMSFKLYHKLYSILFLNTLTIQFTIGVSHSAVEANRKFRLWNCIAFHLFRFNHHKIQNTNSQTELIRCWILPILLFECPRYRKPDSQRNGPILNDNNTKLIFFRFSHHMPTWMDTLCVLMLLFTILFHSKNEAMHTSF